MFFWHALFSGVKFMKGRLNFRIKGKCFAVSNVIPIGAILCGLFVVLFKGGLIYFFFSRYFPYATIYGIIRFGVRFRHSTNA